MTVRKIEGRTCEAVMGDCRRHKMNETNKTRKSEEK